MTQTTKKKEIFYSPKKVAANEGARRARKGDDQCPRMARFFQNLAIYNTKNLPSSIVVFAKRAQNFSKY